MTRGGVEVDAAAAAHPLDDGRPDLGFQVPGRQREDCAPGARGVAVDLDLDDGVVPGALPVEQERFGWPGVVDVRLDFRRRMQGGRDGRRRADAGDFLDAVPSGELHLGVGWWGVEERVVFGSTAGERRGVTNDHVPLGAPSDGEGRAAALPIEVEEFLQMPRGAYAGVEAEVRLGQCGVGRVGEGVHRPGRGVAHGDGGDVLGGVFAVVDHQGHLDGEEVEGLHGRRVDPELAQEFPDLLGGPHPWPPVPSVQADSISCTISEADLAAMPCPSQTAWTRSSAPLPGRSRWSGTTTRRRVPGGAERKAGGFRPS